MDISVMYTMKDGVRLVKAQLFEWIVMNSQLFQDDWIGRVCGEDVESDRDRRDSRDEQSITEHSRAYWFHVFHFMYVA